MHVIAIEVVIKVMQKRVEAICTRYGSIRVFCCDAESFACEDKETRNIRALEITST